jgi:hypothetical protein
MDSADRELVQFLSSGEIGPFSFYTRPLDHATLWIADRNESITDPPLLRAEDIAHGARLAGSSGILKSLERTGALRAIGGRVLQDIRLRADSAQQA